MKNKIKYTNIDLNYLFLLLIYFEYRIFIILLFSMITSNGKKRLNRDIDYSIALAVAIADQLFLRITIYLELGFFLLFIFVEKNY